MLLCGLIGLSSCKITAPIEADRFSSKWGKWNFYIDGEEVVPTSFAIEGNFAREIVFKYEPKARWRKRKICLAGPILLWSSASLGLGGGVLGAIFPENKDSFEFRYSREWIEDQLADFYLPDSIIKRICGGGYGVYKDYGLGKKGMPVSCENIPDGFFPIKGFGDFNVLLPEIITVKESKMRETFVIKEECLDNYSIFMPEFPPQNWNSRCMSVILGHLQKEP